MTALEVLRMTRMMLDDSRDFYYTDIINAIREAQMRKIGDYYSEGNERALRPLYEISDFTLEYGDEVIAANGNHLLYSRGCRIKLDVTDDDEVSINATYVEPSMFNHIYTTTVPFVAIKPPQFIYTINSTGTNHAPRIFFTRDPRYTTTHVARVTYVREPVLFTVDPTTPASDVNLEIAEEYHMEVVALAASILMDMDVMEMERDMPATQARLGFEQMGAANAGVQ